MTNNIGGKHEFPVDDKKTIFVTEYKGNWGKFRRWVGTWLGRFVTNLGAIKIIKSEKEGSEKEGKDTYLNKKSLIARTIESYLSNISDQKTENYLIDNLKSDKTIGKKIIEITCQDGDEKKGIDINKVQNLLQNFSKNAIQQFLIDKKETKVYNTGNVRTHMVLRKNWGEDSL